MRAAEVRELREHLRALQTRLRRDAVAPEGVSMTAARVLAVAERLGPGAAPGQIGAELRMATSNVAAGLRELEGAGLIERKRDGSDSRRVAVTATKAGRKALESVRGERDTWLATTIESTLTPKEQKALAAAGQLLQRLADAP